MKKIFIILTTIATILFFVVACNNEESFAERTPETERRLSLTASLPNDGPTTRVNLTQDEKNILLTWVVNDEIELLFKQETTEITQTITLTSTNISNEGKRAQFDIVIPQEIDAGTFDLYGVYGGGGLSNSDPTKAVLPQSAGNATSLNTPNDNSSVESRKDVMLYFASKNIQTSNPQTSVVFKHLGSLFSVTITNTGGPDIYDLQEAALVEVGGDSNWAYNGHTGGKNFDLVNEEFLETESGVSYISFTPDQMTLEVGDLVTLWAWYPPLPDVNWPELILELYDSNGDIIFETINTKPARTEPTMAGKTYYFYAELDNSQMIFTNSNTFVDSRDGNVYKTVTIDDQIWMAENLKYLPNVVATTNSNKVRVDNNLKYLSNIVGPATGSITDPYYYVYGYNGTDVNAAKATSNYNTYGVLYNWSAAMAGSSSSGSIPSGVQGVCPAGWHLPSDAEWTQMENYLITNGYNYDGTTTGSKIAKSLSATTNWFVSTTEGAVGNNDYPAYRNKTSFTALPGGYRDRFNGGVFTSVGYVGYWASATQGSTSSVWNRRIYYNESNVSRGYDSKETGFYVRCVKD